jgi:hypothetical protein
MGQEEYIASVRKKSSGEPVISVKDLVKHFGRHIHAVQG